MTEKRFTHRKWCRDRKIFDGDEPFAIVDVYIQAEAICDKLNELHEKDKDGEECYRKLLEKYDTLKEENEQLASELVECKALIMMLSDTTVSGRVDNLIYSRYNFYSEDEYYEKLEEYKNKVIKELKE